MRPAYLLAIGTALALAACAAPGRVRDTSEHSTPSSATPVDRGAAVYAANCLTCHQQDGGGVPNLQPALLGSAWLKGEPQALAAFVMTGGFGSENRKGANDNVMPKFAALPDADLAAVLTYIRWNFGDKTGPVTVADVAEARKNLP
jgi:mono/diheme cytochrome c family protein